MGAAQPLAFTSVSTNGARHSAETWKAVGDLEVRAAAAAARASEVLAEAHQWDWRSITCWCRSRMTTMVTRVGEKADAPPAEAGRASGLI